MIEKRWDFKIGFLSILTGLLVGVVVSDFPLAIPIMVGFIEALILFGQNSWLHSILFIFMFSMIGFIVAWNVKKEPLIGGSGIPQVAGKLSGKLDFSWTSILMHKLMGGILTIGSGLTLAEKAPLSRLVAPLGKAWPKRTT